KGMDEEVVKTLEAAVKAGVEGAPYQEFTSNKGLTVKYRDSKEFTEFVMEQFEMYSDLIPSLDLN
ncbi:MAG: hypothetical protein ACRCW1_09730, partial [Anaerotignaceae bacterium]